VKDENNLIVASALVLYRTMPLGKKLFYIPRGPVMDYHNQELVSFVFDHLKALAKKEKAIAIIFDPKVLSRRYLYTKKDEDIPLENIDVIEELKRQGALHKGYTKAIGETYQPRFIAEMDVYEGYMNDLNRKTIRSINTAIKKGTKIYEGKEYIKDFARAMHYTETRKNIALRNEDYFKNMVDVYGDNCILAVAKLNIKEQINLLKDRILASNQELSQADLSKKRRAALSQSIKDDEEELKKLEEDYQNEVEDEIILCGILALFNEKTMEIAYMGNNPKAMRIRASYYLYNHCIEYCEKHGIHECSFGGIEGTLDDGLTIFKSNFIMNVEEYIGEFTIVLDSFTFNLFDKAYPKFRQLMSKLRKK
ncbi:MAG: peptidoglycan bridge formation glycyltransferase FemA/FemB family protein, partial [Solobacterium sp.]|nr:peptidoglycan bridge formation glycyltransferase FemA/FemB family protein [Solobacterium sp.]